MCVYHTFVGTAVEALKGSGIPVAAVSTGFPAGLSPFPQKIEEIKASVKDGASEIDIVIVNLYPFEEKLKQNLTEPEMIENIVFVLTEPPDGIPSNTFGCID